MFHHCVTSIVSYFTPWAVSCYRGGGKSLYSIWIIAISRNILQLVIHCDSGVKRAERGLLAIDMPLVASLRYSWCCRQNGNC